MEENQNTELYNVFSLYIALIHALSTCRERKTGLWRIVERVFCIGVKDVTFVWILRDFKRVFSTCNGHVFNSAGNPV
jgi:hypothetical protein